MTTFVFTETVPTELYSTALGTAVVNGGKPVGQFVSADLGKAVKLGTANNYVLAVAGDNIDGFIKAIEPFTVNDGTSFGGIQMEGRVTAIVGTGPVAVGDIVVADTQVLADGNLAKVKTLATTTYVAGSAGREYWKCIRIGVPNINNVVTGVAAAGAGGVAGAAGDAILLERI
jgi:hypothetical protein